MSAPNDWKAKADAYKARILAQIPPEWLLPADAVARLGTDVTHAADANGMLTDREIHIRARDATSLADKLAAGEFSAVEVATAYLKSAAVAHQLTNCLMDFFPDEALERAKWLDDELKRTGKPVGPLHGVPISVKDMIAVKDRARTSGSLIHADDPGMQPDSDAHIVKPLRDAGAVLYCKTTNPQAIMHLETNSFLGETLNPCNTRLTPGGSSGGESALIAAGGSVLGIGTDIGGSIRNPCSNCGLYGFKPTASRLPKWGNISGMPGQDTIIGAVGPMGVSARDLELFTRVVLASEPWKTDPTQVRMPWRPEEVVFAGGAKPRVGVMWDDGVVVPQPPMRRALKHAVDKLKAAGFEVVDVEPRGAAESWALLKRMYFTDGGANVRGTAVRSGEPLLPLTEWILEGAQELGGGQIMALNMKRDRFRQAWYAWYATLGVDVLLNCALPGPAPVLGTSKYWSYTSLYNLLDMPGAVFPTGLAVDPGNPADAPDAPGSREWLSPDDEAVAAAYDSPETFVGAPLCVQLLAARWEDEKLLEALKAISKAVNP